MNELPPRLKQALDALAARSARHAAKVNADRVAARVLERLRTEPVAARPGTVRLGLPRRALFAVAAAMAIVLAGALYLARSAPPAPVTADACALPACPTGLTAAQSDTLLEALEQVRALNGTPLVSSASVEELNEEQLRALLQAMQSSEEGSL